MSAADWWARGTALVAAGIAVAAFVLSYLQHRRDRERRHDERLDRDSADLSWWTDLPRSTSVGLYVGNDGAAAWRLSVVLERGTRPTLKFDVPVVKRGTPVRCGMVDISFPPGKVDWSITATWNDNREDEQSGIWSIRHLGKS